MSEVIKSIIFNRRGTDAQRLSTTLCQAEIGYSVDGKRAFAGDGSVLGGNPIGNKTFVSADYNFLVTDLTAASATGLAYQGDMALHPASAYALSAVNNDLQPGDSSFTSTSDPSDEFSVVYVLSASDTNDPAGAANDRNNWAPINSGIPYNFLDVPDDVISGDKVHGGNISGRVNLTGSVSTGTLSANHFVATSSLSAPALAGSAPRKLWVTTNGNLSASGMTQQSIVVLSTALSGYCSSSGVGGTNISTVPGGFTSTNQDLEDVMVTVNHAQFDLNGEKYQTVDWTILEADLGISGYSFEDIKGFHVMFQGRYREGPNTGTVGAYKVNSNGLYIPIFGKTNADNGNWLSVSGYVPNVGATDRIVLRLAGHGAWRASFYLWAVDI